MMIMKMFQLVSALDLDTSSERSFDLVNGEVQEGVSQDHGDGHEGQSYDFADDYPIIELKEMHQGKFIAVQKEGADCRNEVCDQTEAGVVQNEAVIRMDAGMKMAADADETDEFVDAQAEPEVKPQLAGDVTSHPESTVIFNVASDDVKRNDDVTESLYTEGGPVEGLEVQAPEPLQMRPSCQDQGDEPGLFPLMFTLTIA